ncbi:MAG: hypothetical protein PHR28_12995 [candidate division Zixibacteria bacterium]|nr:hypothetical protein [candidate division Zixibacteria bacterium]
MGCSFGMGRYSKGIEQMDRNLYNFALVKSLYDQGHDYIDCFWPLLLQYFGDSEFESTSDLQGRLNEAYGMSVPIYVIDTAIKRAKARNLLEQERGGRRFRLTKRGSQYKHKLEVEKDVKRRLNSLAGSIVAFFAGKGIPISDEAALELVYVFVQRNRGPVVEFLNPDAGSDWTKLVKNTQRAAILIEFIQEVDKSNVEQYKTLRDLLLGSLISTIVYAKDAVEMDNLGRKKFRDCRIYLDTNLIFSILELREPEWNKPALELHKLLKTFGFDLFVLPSTIAELCNAVNRYRTVLYRYPSDIKIDSVYSSLRRRGWKASDAQEFITGIEDLLKSKSIIIDWSNNIDLKDYKLKDESWRPTLQKYKPDQYELGQTHDLSAIEIIAAIREHPRRSLEDCKAIFLTSDTRLNRFDFVELRHKYNGTVCEVLLDRLFTNILWLKSPKLELPVEAIIAVHSRDLFINRSVWDRFYAVLQQLHKEKQVNDDKISMLFYHNYIEDILRVFDDLDVDKITPSFVLSHIQKKAELIDKAISDKIRERESEFIGHLDIDISKAEQARNDKWLAKIEVAKARIRGGAEKTTSRVSGIILWLCFIAPSLFVAYLVFSGRWDLLGKFATISSIIAFLAILVVRFVKNIWTKVLEKLEALIYQRRLNKSELLNLDVD